MVDALTPLISYTEKANLLFTGRLNCQEAFKSLWHFNMEL